MKTHKVIDIILGGVVFEGTYEECFNWKLKESFGYRITRIKKEEQPILIKKSWSKEELPIDAMLNLIGYIDTPVGRKREHPDIVSQVQVLKKWLADNNL